MCIFIGQMNHIINEVVYLACIRNFRGRKEQYECLKALASKRVYEKGSMTLE